MKRWLIVMAMLLTACGAPSAAHVATAPFVPVPFATDGTVPPRSAVITISTTTTPPRTTTTHVSRSYSRYTKPSSGSHRGYATVEECISMVEHGGSYDRSSNPSHFGRYQFGRREWVEFGGNAATWGNASPQEQDAVFAEAMRSGATGRWTPYDGC